MPQLAESEPLEKKSRKRYFLRTILPALILAFLVAVGIGIAFAMHYAQPYVHARALELLQQKFNGNVELQDFHVSLTPALKVTGFGLVVYHKGRKDIPPLLAAREFSAEAGVWGLFRLDLEDQSHSLYRAGHSHSAARRQWPKSKSRKRRGA